jgi:hypothetical protein
MTRAEISELVTILMACYPNARFPDGTAVAYENFLIDLELAPAQRAIRTVVRSSKFVPTIAEIIAVYDQEVDTSRRHLTIAEREEAVAAERMASRAARGLPVPSGDTSVPSAEDFESMLDGIGGKIG